MELNLVVRRRSLALIILFIPFLTYNLTAKFGEDVWPVVQMITSVIALIYLNRVFRENLLSKLVALFGLLVCYFTYLNDPSNMQSALFYTIRLVAFFVVMEAILTEDDELPMKFVCIYEGAIIIINVLFMVINPTYFGYSTQSGNNYNFLDTDNWLIYIYIAYIAFLAVYSWRKYHTIRPYVYIMLALCTISMFACWSATGVVGVCILWVSILLHFDKLPIARLKYVLIIFGAIYIGVVVFHIHEYFSDFIVNVLNKDATLSSRTILWSYALEAVRENLFVGMGTMDGGRMLFIPTATGQLYSSHSFFIEILVQTGVLGLILYVVMYVLAGRKLYTYQNEKIYGFLVLCVFSLLCMYLSEGNIYSPMQYMLLISLYHIECNKDEEEYEEVEYYKGY